MTSKALCILLFFFFSYSVSAAGQETDASVKLTRAIRDARQELDAERARIQRELQALQAEQDQLENQAKKLASEMVDSKLSLVRKQTQLETLRSNKPRFT